MHVGDPGFFDPRGAFIKQTPPQQAGVGAVPCPTYDVVSMPETLAQHDDYRKRPRPFPVTFLGLDYSTAKKHSTDALLPRCEHSPQGSASCARVSPVLAFGVRLQKKTSSGNLAARVGSCEGCCNRQFSSSIFPVL